LAGPVMVDSLGLLPDSINLSPPKRVLIDDQANTLIDPRSTGVNRDFTPTDARV
jgi:hypothetical protein